jgi:hypothetical protein
MVKEWLYQVLLPSQKIVRSPKSYNSQIGVPLSVWLLNEQTELGIFEAGISEPGEMMALRDIIQPTVGVFTSLGAAHQENFRSMEEKCMEKLELMHDTQAIIYCSDNDIVSRCIRRMQYKGEKIAWSQCDEQVAMYVKAIEGKTISFRYKGKVVSLSPFAIHTTEVTQQFFKDVMSKIDSTKRIQDRSTFTGARHPVHNITWNDAQTFCKAIGGDLPTEAQWEFAGRADNNEGALWNLDEDPNPGMYAIYKANSYSRGKKSPEYGPQPVSTKKSNAWGIFDMSGNVAEWTKDKYFMFSVWVESSNPTGAMMGSTKVYKGGSWKDKESLLNLTERDDEDPRYWSDAIGFRCAFPRDVFEGK